MLTVLLTAFFCSPVYLLSRPDGFAIELRRTGGNFPSEKVCTDSGCHTGSPNTGPGSISVTAKGMPINQYAYTPGETVPIVVTVAQQGRARWGFQATARTENGCSKAGEMAVSSDQQVLIRSDTSRPSGCPSQGDVRPQFAMHLFAKAGTDMATYEFNWTAPSSDIGPVQFAAAGNAANGDNTQNGDSIYTIQATIEPANILPIIGQGGVVLAAIPPVVSSISANSLIAIFGQNFAPEGTIRATSSDDFVNGRLPMQLAGTCVEIAGRRAPMLFVSPLQMNVQVPRIDSLGPVPVEVIRDCGSPQEQRSETQMVTAESVTPGFFIKGGAADGRNPIAALLFDPGTGGFRLLGDPAEIPGATPAVPGDIVVLFGTGFGRTEPPFEAGELPGGIGGVASGLSSVSVTVGEIPVDPADVLYLGVAPGFAGLYQLNMRLPANAPAGKLPVVVSVSSRSTLEGPYVSVSTAP